MSEVTDIETKLLESIRSLVVFEEIKIKRNKEGKIVFTLKSKTKETYDL